MPTGTTLKTEEVMLNFIYIKSAGPESKAIIDTLTEFTRNHTFDIELPLGTSEW